MPIVLGVLCGCCKIYAHISVFGMFFFFSVEQEADDESDSGEDEKTHRGVMFGHNLREVPLLHRDPMPAAQRNVMQQIDNNREANLNAQPVLYEIPYQSQWIGTDQDANSVCTESTAIESSIGNESVPVVQSVCTDFTLIASVGTESLSCTDSMCTDITTVACAEPESSCEET